MINAFVYGTLRIGMNNYQWASGDVIDEIPNVTTTGGLYFVGPMGGFPVAKLDEPGLIHGDLLTYPEDSFDWQRIYSMEAGAGYRLVEITVKTKAGELIPAVAWHFCHNPGGLKIPDGDWVRAAYGDSLSETA